jgi:hypothetical protein
MYTGDDKCVKLEKFPKGGRKFGFRKEIKGFFPRNVYKLTGNRYISNEV